MITALCASFALGSPGVDMTLITAPGPVPVGCTVEIDLILSATDPYKVASVDALLSWDPSKLKLIQALPSDEDWFVAAFLNDQDGINFDVTDGDALFTALHNPADPLDVPPTKTVATFVFEVLGDGQVELLASLGAFGESRVLGTTPGEAITGALSPPLPISSLSVAPLEVVRLGTPPNPDVFRPGVSGGPVIGTVWDPFVDHTTFMPTALLDILVVTPDLGFPDLPTPFGTVLVDIFTANYLVFSPAGVPFAVGVPFNCALVGLDFCSQAAGLIPAVELMATNALDLTIGSL